jgi:hypothetical protein
MAGRVKGSLERRGVVRATMQRSYGFRSSRKVDLKYLWKRVSVASRCSKVCTMIRGRRAFALLVLTPLSVAACSTTNTVTTEAIVTVTAKPSTARQMENAACEEMLGPDVSTAPISLAPQYVKQIADATSMSDLPAQSDMDTLLSTMRDAASLAPSDLALAIRLLLRPIAQLDVQLSSGDFEAHTDGMAINAGKIVSLCVKYGYEAS